ncbi:GDSL-type esterase/lipase family protein [Clostridium celatum]|nr:GDSL-type esterase/lipase family protein [Clostridium celatum]MCE9655910.1 GDSL-type esterase/lipase family protein [Clostridium celatum]MDU3722673.1 GDSL-type esterase/lipase family protein [Clostridium celatum]MDU6294839.1 GDSL-type esterase/lipase family protein [Clostridium celatum]
MKKILINMLVSSLLVSNIIPANNIIAYENNNTMNMLIEESNRSQSYESYLQYKPLLQFNVRESFNGIDKFIDISDEVENIKDLSSGTIAIKFKTSAKNKEQTLFSISDKNDTNSYFEIKLLNGQIRLETKENGNNVMSYTVPNKTFDDNKWHTVVISGGELGGILYMDGEKLVEFTNHPNKFISLVKDLNNMNIGRIVKNNEVSSYFDGEIEYVEVYNKQFSHEYSSKYSLNDYREILNIIHGEESNNILFAGDSITHGPLHTKGYRSYSEHFNERIRGEAVSGNLKSDNFVINTGVSSADTTHVLASYETWVKTHNPKIVFLTFGMNDCATITIDEYKNNLKTLVNKIREMGAIPIIQTINTTNGSREEQLPIFMEGARAVANELDVFLIDHNKYWSDLGKSVTNAWLGDAIHPNEKGHLEIAKLIFRELQLDTDDSYTQNLSYPLAGNGTAKPVLDTARKKYPEYSNIENKEPVVSYKVNREFYGSDFIDRTDDMDKIKSLNTGSIVTRFNLTSSQSAQTIISLSDSKDSSKEVAIGINANGTIFLNGRTDNGNSSFTTSRSGYNDGVWHTLVMNVDESTINIYVDGENIHSTTNKIFFSSLNLPTHLSIGRNVHDTGGEWFFNGAISYVEIYDNILSRDEINNISSKIDSSNNFAEIRNKALENGVANSWVLVGDNSTSGNGATYGYKNYGEYFEERIRWELRGNPMINRERYVINSGVDGADSESINTNFDKWIAEFDPEIVSIMIGGSEKGTPKEFEANLKEIIEKVRDIGALVMLQTPVLQENDITEYVNVILKVAKEFNVPVVDHYNTWIELEKSNPHIKETFLNEDYRLNHRGHLRVAQDMMKALKVFDSNSISGGALVDMKYEETENPTELKNELLDLINKAKKSIEDNKDNLYIEHLKSALVADIAAAEREIEKTNSTIVTVSNAINFLNESLRSFEEDEVDYGCDVNKDGIITIADLALVSKNYNKNSEDKNWNEIKIYDVNKDTIINNIDIQEVMKKILE